MKRLSLFSAFLLLVFCSLFAKVDDKFLKKAAEEVWAMDLPAFNPQTPIPDSIAEGQSAVYIASFVYMNGDFNQGVSQSKAINLGNATTNVTKLSVIRRNMVKLLDETAVEGFSNIDIDGTDKTSINYYEISREKEGFGARVIKPNGEVIDVDVNKALSVTEGKKGNKEVGRRLQIPGLAVGDVLDYFTYYQVEVDELSPPIINVRPLKDFPVLNFEFVASFDPLLTVEYCPVNGAPLLETAIAPNGRLTASLRAKDLPPLPARIMFSQARQTPYYRFAVLNNHSVMVWHPKLARKPGLYPNIPAATHYREAAEWLDKLEFHEAIVKHTVSYMKSYMKSHPDASRRSLIERAWMAMLYYYYIDPKLSFGERRGALTYCEILRKLKLYDSKTGIGLVKSRQSYPIDCILTDDDPDYVVVVGDIVYMEESMLRFAPGEVGGFYQGEEGAVFYDVDYTKPKDRLPKTFTMPKSTFNRNVQFYNVNVSIDTEGDNLPVAFARDVTLTGSTKDALLAPVDVDLAIREIEDFLEIPEGDRHKRPESEKNVYEKVLENIMPVEVEYFLGVKPTEITESHVKSMGVTPKAKALQYSVSGKVDGLVTDAGDGEFIFDIGRFFGKNDKAVGRDRTRQVDAMLECPKQYVYNVNFEIPEGYTVDEETIQALNQNIQNPVGCYNVNALLSEDGRTLTVAVTERYTTYVVPLGYWDNYLELSDAAADFNETSIVLTPSK